MFKIFLRFFLFVLTLSLIALFQISSPFIWSGFLSEFNLIPIIIVALLFFYNTKTALLATLVFGFWLDLFSFNFFGLESLSLIIALFLLDRISFSWLTNRSFYSFIFNNLIFIFFYSILSALFFYLSHFNASYFFLFQSDFWLSLFFRFSWGFILSFLLFNFFASLTKHLRPVFLEKK